ncbi:MAG: hypothetical protein IKC82_01380 [Lentisphaeria bacterium]|nr:hypothetical protein [Lentisphaeria bacterium]
MENQEEKLPPELREKLLEVEHAAEENERRNLAARFDKEKALPVGACCCGLAFTLGIALRAGVLQSAIFAVLVGLFGYVTAGFQRLKNK